MKKQMNQKQKKTACLTYVRKCLKVPSWYPVQEVGHQVYNISVIEDFEGLLHAS
ncbi:hypothetical protein Phum_PHUM303140 [Pediculus humanus corporis]|uniref:Uncharacterized protein n=1 Tax=Pediculus humanus subsp. corporis TaxID=121224 RepID=E0VM75_PEDHC|nr:uncharacterized protein Phum_PHUM303140 [Pediculus humanus corporis]EEB14481.1 hypothetical protein Phum_PHUM303140 [Pediculus humanus corporis]